MPPKEDNEQVRNCKNIDRDEASTHLARGDIEKLNELLERGYDSGLALIRAIEVHNLSYSKRLLEKGVNRRARNTRDNSGALIVACSNEASLEIIEELLKAGFEPDDLDDGGNSPLIWASIRGNLEVMQALLNAGARVNYSSENRKTALMKAALYGKLQAVSFLAEREAEINASDDSGKTALMFAASRGRYDVISYLLERGANPDQTDKNGLRARDFAEQNGFANSNL